MNGKHSKKTLLITVLALVISFSLLTGSTIAWFTDTVTSENNIIKSGNLDVEMYWADGTQPVPTEDDIWTDASKGAIFNYDLWEPGYTEVRHIKIANVGNLALQYTVNIVSNYTMSDLSDVIDVYYIDPAIQADSRAALTDEYKLGTLTAVMGELGETGYGTLLPGTADTVTIALKMQEEAGNEYMNKALGTNFSIQLLATQLPHEEDSFDNRYDMDAQFSPYTVKVSTAEDLFRVLNDIRTKAKQIIPGADGDKTFRVKANIVLDSDIVISDATQFMYTDSNGAPLHFYGMEGVLDLNGHSITVEDTALLTGKAHANAVLLVQYSNLTIKGEGSIVAKNKSVPVYAWANCTVDIYGGNYVTNAYERNESAVYVNNKTATVNVYGGTYTESKYAFNAHDTSANAPVITLHEGITYADFLKNGTTDLIKSDINSNRIVFAEGCALYEYDENGVAMNKVIKSN